MAGVLLDAGFDPLAVQNALVAGLGVSLAQVAEVIAQLGDGGAAGS
jgi:hypothetical protein